MTEMKKFFSQSWCRSFCHECIIFWKSNCFKQNTWNAVSLWKHIKKLKACPNAQYVFFWGATYPLYTTNFIIVRPPSHVLQKTLHKYMPKSMKPNTFIHILWNSLWNQIRSYIYYGIHYEIWAFTHHLEGEIVFRSKMCMKWFLALKNSQNVYFHTKPIVQRRWLDSSPIKA